MPPAWSQPALINTSLPQHPEWETGPTALCAAPLPPPPSPLRLVYLDPGPRTWQVHAPMPPCPSVSFYLSFYPSNGCPRATPRAACLPVQVGKKNGNVGISRGILGILPTNPFGSARPEARSREGAARDLPATATHCDDAGRALRDRVDPHPRLQEDGDGERRRSECSVTCSAERTTNASSIMSSSKDGKRFFNTTAKKGE